MAVQPYVGNSSMVQAAGPDQENFATYWSGAYAETIPNEYFFTDPWTICFAAKAPDLGGGDAGVVYIRGAFPLVIKFRGSPGATSHIDILGAGFAWQASWGDIDNDWVYFAVQKKDENLYLYTNGKLRQQLPDTGFTMYGGGKICIGYTNPDRYFRGYLYDIRLYPEKALTPAEIQYLFTDQVQNFGQRTLKEADFGKTIRPSDR